MARSIVEHEEACGKAICLWFKDVNSFVNLLQQVLCWKISITIFSGLEDNLSLTALMVSTSLMQQIWEHKTLAHYHLVDGPIQKFGIWISSEKGLSLSIWCMWVTFVAPEILVAVIGIKCWLVMRYEDQPESACLRHIETIWWQICVAIVIIGHHSLLVLTAEQNSFSIQSHPPFHAHLHTYPFSFSHTSNLIFEATVELCGYLFLVPWNQVSLGFLVLRHNQQCPRS